MRARTHTYTHACTPPPLHAHTLSQVSAVMLLPQVYSATMRALRIILAGLALRALLVILRWGQWFMWRVEVSTPANSLLSIREAIDLSQSGIPPYSGSSSHIPPLPLWLLSPFALHEQLYAVPNTIADVLGALMLHHVARRVLQPSGGAGKAAAGR